MTLNTGVCDTNDFLKRCPFALTPVKHFDCSPPVFPWEDTGPEPQAGKHGQGAWPPFTLGGRGSGGSGVGLPVPTPTELLPWANH